MRVKDVMTSKVITISRSSTVREMIDLFLKHHIHLIPVVEKEGTLVGVVSLTSMIKIFMPRYFDLIEDFSFIEDFGLLDQVFLAQEEKETEKLFLVDDIMIGKVITAHPDDSLLKASATMNACNVARLPVVDRDNKLIGIISQSDIVLAIFKGRRP